MQTKQINLLLVEDNADEVTLIKEKLLSVEWHLLKHLFGRGVKAIIVAWMCHQGIGFWSTFSHAWFGTIWAIRDSVFGEDLKQLVKESGLFARLVVDGIERVDPLTQRIDRPLEAEPLDGHMVEGGGMLHESTDDVVGDGMHDDFLADHGRGLAA